MVSDDVARPATSAAPKASPTMVLAATAANPIA